MPNFSAGPWTAEAHVIFAAPGYAVAHINSHRTTEGKANVALVAAAPDMLEALQSAEMALIGYTHQNDVTRKALAQVRAAVAKATRKET